MRDIDAATGALTETDSGSAEGSEVRRALARFIRTDLARGRTDIDVERDALVESGVIDSVGIMKLVEFIERTLGLRVADQELLPENFETLEAMTAFLTGKRRGTPRA